MRDFVTHLACCLRFYSRLPVPVLPWETDPHGQPDFAAMPRALPVAGAILGVVAAPVLILALAAGLGPFLSAALCLAALTWITGAFHEDGLADTADGFGGGATPEQRLEIMRDSRIGSFGGAALVLGFALRIGALAALAERADMAGAAAGFVAAAAVSRVAGLAPLTFLPAARLDGVAFTGGRPSHATFWLACGLAALLALGLVLASGLPVAGWAGGLVAASIVAAAAMRLSLAKIGGQTGDVAGATTQIAEAAFVIGLLIPLAP
jgi:adenosylcobinamide-GDP ribazoletransferase